MSRRGRRCATAAICCGALLLSGCGGSDPNPEDDVREVATELYVAQLEGDGEEACGLMTESAQRQMVASANRTMRQLVGSEAERITECSVVIGLAAEFARGAGADEFDAEQVRAEMTAEVEDQIASVKGGEAFGEISVAEDTATVEIKLGDEQRTARFRNLDGRWLLDSPP